MQTFGDVLVNYLPDYIPSWQSTGTTHGSPYSCDTHAFVVLHGWNIKQGSSAEQILVFILRHLYHDAEHQPRAAAQGVQFRFR